LVTCAFKEPITVSPTKLLPIWLVVWFAFIMFNATFNNMSWRKPEYT
jgi:uncharacterized membrane protein